MEGGKGGLKSPNIYWHTITSLSPSSETCMPPNTVWQCEICADVFPDKVQLHAHILAAHSAATYETTQCPHCRQHFETKHGEFYLIW